MIELASYRRPLQIFKLIDVSRAPVYYLRDPEYLRAEIPLGGFGKLHLLLGDAHVLPHGKLGLGDRKATSLATHPLQYRDNIRIGHSRRRHTRRGMNRVIVGSDKFL